MGGIYPSPSAAAPAPRGTDSLVSIGVPTYNRADTLVRALDSAVAQSYARLEIVISDNASDDGTERLCRRYAEQDSRIRYLRHPDNRGPTANFNFLFGACRGDLVMMLADDDWLDPDYVRICAAELQRRPDHALVAGLAVYHRAEREVAHGAVVRLAGADGAARVLSFYRQVDDNGTFYGVMRGGALRAAGPMSNELGNDWQHLAAIAFQGKILTLGETRVHRELGGTSHTLDTIRATLGADGGWETRIPHLYMAARAARDIALRRPVYRSLSRPRRLALALRVIPAAVRWQALAWHLTAPTMARLQRRRRGRTLWRAFLRLTRALGAGRTRLG